MSRRQQAWVIFVGALALSAAGHKVVRQQGAVLGLSMVQVAALGVAASAVADHLTS